jgi:hypothetical protein
VLQHVHEEQLHLDLRHDRADVGLHADHIALRKVTLVEWNSVGVSKMGWRASMEIRIE